MEHEDAMAYLAMFSENTYGLEIPRELASYMQKCGYVEWVPPKFGTTLYAITEEGRKALLRSRS